MSTVTTRKRPVSAGADLGYKITGRRASAIIVDELVDPVPLAMMPDDQVYLILPVTVRQRCRDGSIHVVGSGLTRFAQPHELLRTDQVLGLRGNGR